MGACATARLPGHAKRDCKTPSTQSSLPTGRSCAESKSPSFGVSSVTASPEDEERIKQLQQAGGRSRIQPWRRPLLASAQGSGDAGRCEKTKNGAFMAFAGMNAAAKRGRNQCRDSLRHGTTAAGANRLPAAGPAPSAGQTGKHRKVLLQLRRAKNRMRAGTCAKCGQTGNTGKILLQLRRRQKPE